MNLLGLLILIIGTPIMSVIVPTVIVGKKNLKKIKKKSAIYCCNHYTNFDAIIVKSRIDWNMKMMSKDSLFQNPFNRLFFKSIGAYPIKRGGNDIESVKKTLTYLKKGNKVSIFPEGTRVKDGDESKYKNGLVFFALKTDCFVVPMVLRNRPGFFKKTVLVVGEPFKYSDIAEFKDKKFDKDLLENATKILTEKMNGLKMVNIKEYKKSLKNK